MRRSASNFIAVVTSAVGSIVTTSPRLLAKIFLTIMIASLPVVAGRATIRVSIMIRPKAGSFKRETVQCDKTKRLAPAQCFRRSLRVYCGCQTHHYYS